MNTNFTPKLDVGITSVLRRYCVGASHLPLKTKGQAK
ncbi:MAG: hypothetical protein ACI9PU_001628 [Ascidiaceihabitans sp.]|jgi:hypothetical protein